MLVHLLVNKSLTTSPLVNRCGGGGGCSRGSTSDSCGGGGSCTGSTTSRSSCGGGCSGRTTSRGSCGATCATTRASSSRSSGRGSGRSSRGCGCIGWAEHRQAQTTEESHPLLLPGAGWFLHTQDSVAGVEEGFKVVGAEIVRAVLSRADHVVLAHLVKR